MPESTESSKPAAHPKRRRWPYLVGGVAVVLVLLVAFAPVLIATFGKGSVVNAINNTIKGSVAIDSLSLAWFGSQRITGLELRDPDGKTVATAKDVSTELSLWQAIRGDMNLGKTVIAGVDGDVKVDADGSNNLLRAIELREPAPETDEPTRVPPSLAIDAELRDAKIRVTPASGKVAEFNDLKLAAKMTGVTQPITVTMSGVTKQGEVSGSFDGQCTLSNLFDADGLLTKDKAAADVKLNATDIPAAGLDGLLALGGILAEATGEKLNASVLAAGTADAQTATVTLASQRLNASLKTKIADGLISLAEPARIELIATPGLVSAIVRRSDPQSKQTLRADTKFVGTIDALSAPVGAFDPARTAIRARLVAEQPIGLTGDPAIGDATISDLVASVDAPNLADAVEFALNADLLVDGQPGKVAVNGKASNLFDAKGNPQYAEATADAVVSIVNLPTALVDRFMPADALAAPLAEMVGPSLNLDATATTPAAGRIELTTLSIRSDRLNVQLPLILAERITSASLGSIEYDMPRSVAVAYKLTEKNLAFDPVTKLRIANLVIDAPRPVEGKPAFQPDQTKINGELTLSNVTYNLDADTHVTLSNLVAKLTGQSLAAAKVNATTAAILANGSDRIARFTGRRADISLAATVAVPSGDQPVTADDVALVVTSDVMKLTALAQLTADRFSLKRPATLDYTLTQKLLDDLKAWPQGYPPLAGPTPIKLTVTKLAAPMPFDMAKLDVEASGTLTPAEGNDPLRELFGGPVEVAVRQSTGPRTQTESTTPFELTIKSERVTLSAPGELSLAEPMRVNLAKADARATITPQLVAMLKLVEPGATTIAEPVTATLAMQQTALPLSGFDAAKLKTNLTAEVDRIVLTGGGGKVDGTIITALKTAEPLAFDGPVGTMSVKLTGGALAKGQSGEPSPIAADVKMTKLVTDGKIAVASAAIDANVDVQRMPTAVIDALAGQGGKLEPIVGPTANLTARVNTTGGAATSGTAVVNVTGENLVAAADLKLAGDLVTLTKPAKIQWTVTPAAYAALTKPAPNPDGSTPKPSPLSLTEPAVVNATIDTLSYPLPAPQGPNAPADAPAKPTDWSKVALNATITAPSLKLIDANTKRPVTISDLNAKASTANLATGLSATTTAKLATVTETGGEQKAGDLNLTAKLTDLFDAAGVFNKDGLSADVDAKVIGIPGSLAEAIAGSGTGKTAALIGESGDITARAKLQRMQGPVAIDIKSQNTTASIDGRLESGYFYLNKDADASLMVTEELASLKIGGSVVDVLAGMLFDNPLLKQAVNSIEPVKLHIAAEGFSAPLDAFSIDKVKIASGTVNPGKLMVKNAGLINTLVTLPSNIRGFKPGKLIQDMSAKNTMQAWFTDMPFSVRDGVAKLGRMDMMLGDDYQVAVWGTLNLAKQPRQVDGKQMPPESGRMILGLAERALRRVYGINSFKDKPNYVDQFVMEGPIATLGPDKTELVGRIALLTAAGASGAGDTVGGILQGVGGILKETGVQKKFDAPPPAPKSPWPPEPEPDAKQPADATKPAPDQPQPAQPTQPPATTDKPKKPREKSDTEKVLDALEGLDGLFGK